VELWAFSLMELGILLIIILWAIENIIVRPLASENLLIPQSAIGNPQLLWFFYLFSPPHPFPNDPTPLRALKNPLPQDLCPPVCFEL